MRKVTCGLGLAALLTLLLIPAHLAAQEGGDNGFQNLQVFDKDIEKQQLKRVMKGFTQQLGVKCVYCHVPDEYHKDDKEHKQVARSMIRMMQNLRQNADEFFPDGRNEKLRCWTCHRGSTEVEEFVPEEGQR